MTALSLPRRGPRARWYSHDAAAATAAYRVLLALVPGQQPALAPCMRPSLASIPAGEAKQGGIAVGEIAAAAMLTARSGDGRGGAYRFPAPATPQDAWPVGQWRPVLPAFGNDPAAWIKDVRPFLIRDPARYASDGPHRARPAATTRASSTRSRRSARSRRPSAPPTRPTRRASGPRDRSPGRAPRAGSRPSAASARATPRGCSRCST